MVARSRKIVVHRDDFRGVRTFPLYSTTSVVPIDHSYFYAVPGDSAIMQFDTYIIDVAAAGPVKVQDAPVGYSRRSAMPSGVATRASCSSCTPRVPQGAQGIAGQHPPAPCERSCVTLVHPLELGRAVAKRGPSQWRRRHLLVVRARRIRTPYRYGKDGTLKNQVERGDYRRRHRAHRQRAQAALHHRLRQGGRGRTTGISIASASTAAHDTPHAGAGASLHPRVPRAPFFIDTWSTISTPPVTVLRSADGRIVMELSKGDVTGLTTTGWTPAEVVSVKARDGQTDLWGIMHRPSDFDPAKRYPIVVRVYRDRRSAVSASGSSRGPTRATARATARPTRARALGSGRATAWDDRWPSWGSS